MAASDWVGKLLSGKGLAWRAETPLVSREIADLVSQFLNECVDARPSRRDAARPDIETEFDNLSKEQQIEAVLALLDCGKCVGEKLDRKRMVSSADPLFHQRFGVQRVLERLMRRKLPWSEDQASAAFAHVSSLSWHARNYVPIKRFVGVAEQFYKDDHLTIALRSELAKLESQLRSNNPWGYTNPDDIRTADRVRKVLLEKDPTGCTTFVLVPADAWTDAMVRRLNGLSEQEQHAWTQLLAHCDTAKSSSPTKAFLKQARAQIDAIGESSYVQTVSTVLDSVGRAYHDVVRHQDSPWSHSEPTLVDAARADLLRGLVWTTSLVDDRALLTALATAADRCFQKVRSIGPRAPKIGNACLWVFAHSESLEAVAQLNRLMGRVKHASVRKQIERSLNAASQHHGMTRGDLEDMAVPTCGLTGVGEIRQAFAEFEGELSILSTTTVKTEWRTPQGKVQKTVPKPVKEDFAVDLKAWKANEKLLKQSLTGQRDRLEGFFSSAREWRYPVWRERVLDHPLMGWLARRLVWTLHNGATRTPAIYCDGQLVDQSGEAVKASGADTKVTLWHPIESEPAEVQAWRDWMLAHEITQPFKQAHREVYLLTDAERTTREYSNRFAAHVLKQHQLRALCQARGWRFDLMGNFDSHNVPEKVLPEHNLRAEFWLECSGAEQTSDMGIFLYIATDQVRFYRYDASVQDARSWDRTPGELLVLEEVPALAFSEIMRDVDLFVGVASVGNDPNWQDGGPDGVHRDYWHDASFGHLGATAQTRREILQRLVPRLKIAGRCTFDDKFLIVRGDKRTYKIHLGSSNILMEPNDQYLCIVPGRGEGPAGKVFLPFEGDQRLAVILSKAMMLAEDAKIKDPTILSQIGR